MAYITPATVRTTIWKVTATEVDDNILGQAIDMAAADIDSALGAAYVVPFEEPYPEVILAINAALLRYYGQFLKGHVYNTMSEPDQRAYDWAQEKLKALRSGIEVVPGVSRRNNRVRCNTSGYHSTFNLDDPKYWEQDPNREADIADERSS